MIVCLFVLTLLQMFVLFRVEGSGLTDSTCSRIVATPGCKTDTMNFFVGSLTYIEVEFNGVKEDISIDNNVCTINNESIGKPCGANSDGVIITINDTAQFKSLFVIGAKRRCIATFVPKCEFKPVESGQLIPQAAFPFAKFAKGKRSVNITFSVKGLSSKSWAYLYKNYLLQCLWNGLTVDKNSSQENCVNLTENTAKDQLDGTVVYERVSEEEIADFVIYDGKSRIGISVFWEKKGPSPDIAECQKYVPSITPTQATTSGAYALGFLFLACALGYLFLVLLGITQWMFK